MKIPTASQKNPFAFFEFILSNKHGINSLKKEFFPSQEDLEYYGHKLSYNDSTEEKVLVTFNNISGEEEIEVYKFRDVLYERIKEEYSRCISIIDEEILVIQDNGRIGVYINVIFARLNYLRNKLKILSDVFIKYPELNKFPDALESLLKEKYSPYVIENTLQVESDNIEIKSISKKITATLTNPGVFKWVKGDPNELNKKLYAFLSENRMIDSTIDAISMAFSGNDNGYPLKIKWIDNTKSNASVNKITLLYMFQKLSINGMIDCDFESKQMMSKLTYIFVDRNGQTLQNLNQSKAYLKSKKTNSTKKTWSKKLIDQFMLSFCTIE